MIDLPTLVSRYPDVAGHATADLDYLARLNFEHGRRSAGLFYGLLSDAVAASLTPDTSADDLDGSA